MLYDFDKIIDRTGTGALKNEVLQKRYGRADLLPLWVADMDFETPPFIVDAIRSRMDHPIFGYTVDPVDYWPSVIDWVHDHHQWDIKKEWLSYIPGVVKGIGMAINALTVPGDKVIIQTPVYHPFRLTIKGNDREAVYNPLKMNDSGDGSFYEMDFENLESIIDPKCKILVLCNPHNPAGIAWTKETLQRLASICYKHNIVVLSDEIHADLAVFGHKHVPFATVSEEAEKISVTFQAPTKTFNMAGIVSSFAIVPDDQLREKLYRWIGANELNEPNVFAPIATVAAFRNGEQWRQQMLAYVEDNILYMEDYCRKYISEIKIIRPESSFLVWMDCRGLGLKHDALQDLFINKARLALNDGEMFDTDGNPYGMLPQDDSRVNAAAGFMRINVGTPRSILSEALEQLRAAVESIR